MADKIRQKENENILNGIAGEIFTRGYQMVEDMLSKEWKPRPVKVEGKCCERCVHKYGDKQAFCAKHNNDDNCFKFKLEL